MTIALLSYLVSLYNLLKTVRGCLVTKEQLKERFKICTTCDKFDGCKCVLCGCCTNDKRNLLNKLAFPTEQCPNEPPKWGKLDVNT